MNFSLHHEHLILIFEMGLHIAQDDLEPPADDPTHAGITGMYHHSWH